GLSCGFTLYQTIRQLRERRFRDLALYPLSGESTLRQVDLFPNTLVGMMAAKYRPHVQAYALPVHHLLSLGEIERERRRLLRDRLQALSRRADRSVVAIAGGRAKLEAVRGALAGHFMNVLVTDEDVATALVRRAG